MSPQSEIRDDVLRIGASWYPEMWPEEEWPKDLARMQELGFNIVRVFEFAWHRFEPEEGKYDFAWAKKLLDLCHEHGIGVMIGTPTAAPPAWLTERYPEVLKTKPDGTRQTHGGRRHYSHTSPKYRLLSAQIVKKMAEAFADHPALHSWQIDNEMSGSDFSETTQQMFREWLEKRYGSIEQLNQEWGLEFWSQAYNDFGQMRLARATVGEREIQERAHPSLVFASARFNTDAWEQFVHLQCEIIRKHSDKPITTNMCGGGLGFDWFQVNRQLDRVGYSFYKDVDHYHWSLFFFERMRNEKRAPYWLLETAPSWSAGGRIWNIHHDAQGVQAATWLSTLLGGSMVLYWQWRQHWAGQEMLHGTCVTATGRWRPNKDAWTKLAAQFNEHGPWLLDNPPKPAEVGVVFATQGAWATSIDPTDDDMSYSLRYRDDFYLPLCENHIWRDVVHPTQDWSSYKILIMPLLQVVDEKTKQRLREWVAAGGRLVLGPLTGIRTEEYTVWRDREFGGLEDLIGATSALRFTVKWMEDRVDVDWTDGHTSRTRALCDAFEPQTADVLARYRGGYGDGLPAVMENKVGEGVVVTLGCMPDRDSYLAIVKRLMDEAGVAPVGKGSPRVVVVPRADASGQVQGYGVVNLTESPQAITLPHAGTDLLSGTPQAPDLTLEPLEVRVIRK